MAERIGVEEVSFLAIKIEKEKEKKKKDIVKLLLFLSLFDRFPLFVRSLVHNS